MSKNFLYYDNIKPTALGRYQLICYFFTVDENENKKIRWEILSENILYEFFGNFQIFAKKKNFSTAQKNLPTKKITSQNLPIKFQKFPNPNSNQSPSLFPIYPFPFLCRFAVKTTALTNQKLSKFDKKLSKNNNKNVTWLP